MIKIKPQKIRFFLKNGKKSCINWEAGSGKSTFCKKMITGVFETSYIPTLGVEVYPICDGNYWDTAGQHKYGGLRDGYYLKCDKA